MESSYRKVGQFALVGGFGFFVDSLVMVCLHSLLPLPVARALAFWSAASSNWVLNRRWTFSYTAGEDDTADKPKADQYQQFLLSSCVAFLPNWGISLLMFSFPQPSQLCSLLPEYFVPFTESLWLCLAMIPGVLAGMLVNYQLADRWVFARA
ncbi:GtrA family protein [Corallincola platygyrae]|uniref:GtrA family protein n=1 Tax=Corallincola platygyrae TaxID=1193278 RepID=A0ABW4XQR4_9GAMM